jgi:hypothetical protein
MDTWPLGYRQALQRAVAGSNYPVVPNLHALCNRRHDDLSEHLGMISAVGENERRKAPRADEAPEADGGFTSTTPMLGPENATLS